MKQFTKLALAGLLAFAGSNFVQAQVPDGYYEVQNWKAFESKFTIGSLPKGWDRYVDGTEITYTGSSYSPYTCGTASKQADGSYDLLVTPQIKGDLNFKVSRYAWSDTYVLDLQFYKLTKTDDGYSIGERIEYSIPEDRREGSNVTGASDLQTISIGEDYTYVGIRISQGYIQELSAPSALLPIVKDITIASTGYYMDGYSYNIKALEDGTFKVGGYINVTNASDVALNADEEENYTISLVRNTNNSNPYTYEVLETVPLPSLGIGETKRIEVEGTYEIPDLPVNDNGVIRFRLDFVENYTGQEKHGSISSWAEITPFQSILTIMYDKKSTSNGSITDTQVDPTKPINYGSFKGSRALEFRLRNRGAAPMIISDVEKPEWISFEDFETPFAIGVEEIKPIKVVVAGDKGIKDGTVKFITNGVAIVDEIAINAEVVGEDEFFADFESEDAIDSWYMPDAAAKWSIASYTSTERNYSENFYAIEYGFNDKKLNNSQQNADQSIYSPKLHFDSNESISFYAAKNTNSGAGIKIIVSYSPDRTTWEELGTITVTNDDPDLQFSSGTSSSTTSSGQSILKHFSFDMPEGDYYISFNGQYVSIDNFHGGKLVDVDYDIVGADAVVGKTKIVNNPLDFTATFRNLNSKDVEAEEQTVTLYANGEAVATAEPQTIEGGKSVTYDFSYTPHADGETTLYAEIAIGDYTVKTADIITKIEAESLTIKNQIGETNDFSSVVPISPNYGNTISEIIYTSEMLGEIKGSNIIKISYPYYKTSDEITGDVTIWMENTDDAQVGDTFTDIETIKQVAHIKDYVFEKAGTGVNDYAEMTFVLDEPFEYTGGNLRIMIEKQGDTYKSANFVVDKNVNAKTIYYRLDSNSSFKENRFKSKPTAQTGIMPVINLYTELEVAPVTGTVKDLDGKGVKDAVVRAYNGDVYYETTSDEDGNWSMILYQNDLDYKVFASHEKYGETGHQDLDKENGENHLVLQVTGTGIVNINAEENGNVRYFDLNGIELNGDKLQNGVYIRVKGNKAEKVIVKK